MDRDEMLRLLRGGPDSIAEWNQRKSWKEDIPNIAGLDQAEADLKGIDLSGIQLNYWNLAGACLTNANLAESVFFRAILADAKVDHACLLRARLDGASLKRTDFTSSDLRRARFFNASLVDTIIRDADFEGAWFGDTVIACNLANAVRLGQVSHRSPSHIALDSLLSLPEDFPSDFLRGCGLREEDIAYIESQTGRALRFYSCFISYSTDDEEFASRLHNDLQQAGIRCWKWDHDAKTGKSLWGEIDQAIRLHDKVVLVVSESSLQSPAVNREIERAIRLEDERERLQSKGMFTSDTNVLFPVRLDDFIFTKWQHERKPDVTKKVIADATQWKESPTAYQSILNRLIHDLSAE